MNFCVKMLLLVVLLWPVTAVAELSDDVQADFAVLSGFVVMQINDEYLIDLDARDNLHVGDILTLVKAGKSILHPITKEVLGRVEIPAGFLQVTRTNSGYSYARLLTEGVVPENGAPLKRFEQVPAVLETGSQASEDIALQIQVNLPQFQWLDTGKSEDALLTFSLQGDHLDVRTAQGTSLHKYAINENQQLVSSAASAPRPYGMTKTGPEPKILQQLANTLMGTVTETNEERFAKMDEAIIRQRQKDRQGIWMGPNLDGHPTGLVVTDLDGDGKQEIAVVLKNNILIARVTEGQFNVLQEVDVRGSLQMLSIDALDMDNDGRSELYVSALGANGPSSFVVKYENTNYGITYDGVRWFMRAVRLPGEENLTLVGQLIDNSAQVFSGDVFRVQYEAGELVKGEPVDLPSELNLFNFISFTDESGQLLYLFLTDGDYLEVLSTDGRKLWGSDVYFGGSEDCFTMKARFRDEIQIPTCMRPRFVMIPGNEILAVQNEGQRMVQRYRKFEKSQVVSMVWNGFAFVESWRTASQPGYLGDFALGDADNDGDVELVMAVKFNHEGLTDKARSSVVIYELN